LRKLPEAGLLGLGMPRFLLRQPYGENTVTIDSFTFEEVPATKKKKYLWGNPALACASLLCQGFNKDGWSFKPGNVLDLIDMPMHVYTDDDEEQTTLAEAWLNRPMVEQQSKFGFMCLLCVKAANRMQLFRFQALAQPGADKPFAELLGPWGQEGIGKLPSSKPPLSVSVGMGVGEPSLKAPPPPPPEPKPAAKEPAPGKAPAEPEEAPAPAAEPEMDPELAALMAELEGGEPAAAAPAAPAPAAAAEPEMDPELAALMAELEGGAPAAPAAPPAAPAAEEGSGDPELDALMKDLMGGEEK
jgi:hypothetical protein